MATALFTQHYPRGSAAFKTLVAQDVKRALREDIGRGDLTVTLIPASNMAHASIITREDAIICGIDWVNACFQQIDSTISVKWLVNEGDKIVSNQPLCEINGNARAILSAERCALNFLQLMSAVATQTQQYVMAVSGSNAQILDTRKTIPGLRLAQKYAVTAGGGANQRLALYDGILIKENHIAAAGSIQAALDYAFKKYPDVSIQIEVENLDQLMQAFNAGANSVLLDNFSLSEMKEAVRINLTDNAGRALLEASGGINLSSVRAIALTGVDRISVGALTKNIRAVDLSLRIK